MAGVRDHTELQAWQLADAVRLEVLKLTDEPRFRAHFDLRTQLNRAAESACTNIAEGFSRYLPKDFARFLRIAGGSLSETIELLTIAGSRSLVEPARLSAITSLARRARGACVRLIRYLESARAPI